MFYDARTQPPSPGLHVLIIGVSAYKHLPGGSGAPATAPGLDGLTQLPSSARTASDLANLLLKEKDSFTPKLQTVRLLHSPSPTETGLAPATDATYSEIKQALNEWRDDARLHRDNVTLFFFSGHGVGGTLDDSIMLPSDFADPAQQNISTNILLYSDLVAGMRPLSIVKTIAKQQIYFVDACRNRVKGLQAQELALAPTVWNGDPPDEMLIDDRSLAELFATINGMRAFAGRAGELTLFGQAVLDCVQGAATQQTVDQGQLAWQIGTTDITARLPELMSERNQKLHTTQSFRTGQAQPIPLIKFPQRPTASAHIVVDPATSLTGFGITLRDNLPPNSEKKVQPIEPHPHDLDLPMGLYQLSTSTGGTLFVNVRPVRCNISVKAD
jgi:hypothetical protein